MIFVYECMECSAPFDVSLEEDARPDAVRCPGCGCVHEVESWKRIVQIMCDDDTSDAPMTGATEAWRKGLRSDAMGVLASQVAKAESLDKALGAPPVEYEKTKDGRHARPVFRSRRQRRDWCRAHNVVDHDGGYGDV